MRLYHNPRCSKSREAKQILEDNKISFETFEYLKEGLTGQEILSLSKKLSLSLREFMRLKEEDFKPYKNKELTESELVDLIVNFPKLLERPILVSGTKAVLGRPPQRVLEII
ncbi:MAG: ArsC/Spx/MgsR family protein [Bdellovibrionales bacterium]